MERKTLMKEVISAGRRLYVIEVKETKENSKYLSINEYDPTNKDNQSHRILIFEDHIEGFQKGLEKAFAIFKSAKIGNPPKTPAYTVADIRKKHPRAYEKWSEEEDEKLRNWFLKGQTIKELAMLFQRQEGSIRSRLEKLNLYKKEK